MPDVVGPIHIRNPRDTASTQTFTYFDQSSFAPTTCSIAGTSSSSECGTFGTANRRFFHGPGFNNTDLGITKRIPITEQKAFEIRGEFFNIFNHAQFNNPSGTISNSSGFGNVTSARAPRIGLGRCCACNFLRVQVVGWITVLVCSHEAFRGSGVADCGVLFRANS